MFIPNGSDCSYGLNIATMPLTLMLSWQAGVESRKNDILPLFDASGFPLYGVSW